MANTNLRMPPLDQPGQNSYPYVEFEQFRDGSWKRRIVYPGREAYSHGHMLGSFKEVNANGAQKVHSVDSSWEYTQQGKTHTVEGNHDSKIGASKTEYVSQDHYTEHGQDLMKAMGGAVIQAAGGSTFIHSTKGTQIASTGDNVSDHNDGSNHQNVANDWIHFVGNNKYEFIGGEHGVFVSNGNMDVNVNKKLNLQSKDVLSLNSSANITLTATSSLTITVGQSTIVVNGSAITIQSGNVYVNPLSGNVFLGGNSSTSTTWLPVLLAGEIPAKNVMGAS